MTHRYSSCRSACLSATWRFREALLQSTLPHSWQVKSFLADGVFSEFNVSPGMEASTETQQCTSCSTPHLPTPTFNTCGPVRLSIYSHTHSSKSTPCPFFPIFSYILTLNSLFSICSIKKDLLYKTSLIAKKKSQIIRAFKRVRVSEPSDKNFNKKKEAFIVRKRGRKRRKTLKSIRK